MSDTTHFLDDCSGSGPCDGATMSDGSSTWRKMTSLTYGGGYTSGMIDRGSGSVPYGSFCDSMPAVGDGYVSTMTSGVDRRRLVVRYTDNADRDGYEAYYYPSLSAGFRIYRRAGGTETKLAETAGTSPAAGGTWEFEAAADGGGGVDLTIRYAGSDELTVNEGTATHASGRMGFYCEKFSPKYDDVSGVERDTGATAGWIPPLARIAVTTIIRR